MKYPELRFLHFQLPESFTPAVPAPLKLIPIPAMALLDTSLEAQAIQQYEDFIKAKEEFQRALDERSRTEKLKSDAFSKVLIPLKSGSVSELSANLRDSSVKEDELEVSTELKEAAPSDYTLLKEIIGGASSSSYQQQPVEKQPLPPHGGSLGSNTLPHPIPFPINMGGSSMPLSSLPGSLGASSSFSSILSIDSPPKTSLNLNLNPPKPTVPSPSKANLLSNLGNIQTFESLVLMGFRERNVKAGMVLFSNDQEILNFLTTFQELPPLFCNSLFDLENPDLISSKIVELHSLAEMGFGLVKSAGALGEANLDKAAALEILLREA